MDVAIGVVVLLVGASAAAAATQRLPAMGRGRLVLPALVVAGALIGAGGALVRGWDLVGTTAAGAALVPVVAIVLRVIETRRGGTA